MLRLTYQLQLATRFNKNDPIRARPLLEMASQGALDLLCNLHCLSVIIAALQIAGEVASCNPTFRGSDDMPLYSATPLKKREKYSVFRSPVCKIWQPPMVRLRRRHRLPVSNKPEYMIKRLSQNRPIQG